MEECDIKNRKGEQKAIDEGGKQFGGNEGKTDAGAAQADKKETQRQGYYEQDTHHDDIGGQTTEMMGKDLTRGINELQLEEQEERDKVAIFEGIVTREGIHLDLNVGTIHLTFPPDTVAEPTRITVYRWRYGACLPDLSEHEAVMSNVIEISAAKDVGVSKFNSEVKLVLSHSAAHLEGYELIMKRLSNVESNEWEDIPGCEDIRQVSGIFKCSQESFSTYKICAQHRHGLGIGWRGKRKRCQVPQELSNHKENPSIADRTMDKKHSCIIKSITATLVPVGSGMFVYLTYSSGNLLFI